MVEVEFKIIREDASTHARLGMLKINGRKINTPTLWLGCSIKNKPHPWKYFDVDAIMVNAYEIIQKKLVINSIHKFLNTDSMVMMDCGGFQLMKIKRYVTPIKILKIYEQAEPDIGVVLDFPFNPLNPSDRMERWKKTLENTRFMFDMLDKLDNSYDIVLLPVIHGYTLEEIKRACEEIKDITDPKIVSIGSLVPVIRHMKTSNLSKLNRMNAIKFMVSAVSTVREEFPDALLHVFGVGSVATMHLMFSLGVDSVDSASWRVKAAYGAIQLPGIGDRFISPKKCRKKFKEDYALSKCECPVCSGKLLTERMRILDNSKPDTFHNRAIHNAYVLKEEEKAFRNALAENNTIGFLRERLRGSRYYKLGGSKYYKLVDFFAE